MSSVMVIVGGGVAERMRTLPGGRPGTSDVDDPTRTTETGTAS